MKQELKDKTLRNSRLADELKRSEGYQEILKKSLEKIEKARKDVFDSKTIDDVRYQAGLIKGLEFFDSTVEQWIQRAKSQRKRINKQV